METLHCLIFRRNIVLIHLNLLKLQIKLKATTRKDVAEHSKFLEKLKYPILETILPPILCNPKFLKIPVPAFSLHPH